jgi:hypothetical protein
MCTVTFALTACVVFDCAILAVGDDSLKGGIWYSFDVNQSLDDKHSNTPNGTDYFLAAISPRASRDPAVAQYECRERTTIGVVL